MKIKKALIFGISGQDGSYLANFLIKKRYKVDGVSKSFKYKNLKLLKIRRKIKIFKYPKKMDSLLKKNYDEIYFLGGQPNVFKSFSDRELTYNSQIKPLIPILENIRMKKIKSKFLYASSSEIYGNYKNKKRKDENSFKQPVSPYGLSKLIGFEIIKSYREMFKIPVCSVIFFNHESPLRSKEFVTKKIVDTALKIKRNKNIILRLGNVEIVRDWGWAPDYVRAIWLMMQRNKPRDFIIGSGKTYSLKDFVNEVFKYLNISKKNLKTNVSEYKRKIDLRGYKANIIDTQKILKWKPKLGFKTIIHKMIDNELF